MSQQQEHGIVKKKSFSEADQVEILQLVEKCNEYEHLQFRLNSDMLREYSHQETASNLLCYARGKLVGCMLVYNTDHASELSAMVHPEYRRRGIFRSMLNMVMEECKEQGITKLLLVCESTSRSGRATIAAIGAQNVHAEHFMVLANFQERPVFDDRLMLRKAYSNDLEPLLTCLRGEQEEEITRPWLTKALQKPHVQFYLATFGNEGLGCEEPVGCLRVYDWQDAYGIYTFVIIADYRGRGYGRQMLEEIIRSLRAQSDKKIILEVDSSNIPALNLYQSCGFEIHTTYGYYALDL